VASGLRVTELDIEGARLIETTPRVDERGFFVRTLDAEDLSAAGIAADRFVQENHSRSHRPTLRGIHLRAAPSEAKLVRCGRGAVFDVVVDLRPASPTFGTWRGFVLDDVRHRQLYVPPGCGHGFQVLSDFADVTYHHDAYYDPALEAEVAHDDPDLGVAWPLEERLVSDRDRRAPSLRELLPSLEAWFGAAPGGEGVRGSAAPGPGR
jgi:dTDP-4-dehydrorhamnose 3,5-epimerase